MCATVDDDDDDDMILSLEMTSWWNVNKYFPYKIAWIVDIKSKQIQ